MTQNGEGHSAHVFDVGAVLAGKGGVAFGGQHQVLGGTGSSTPAQVLVDLLWSVLTTWTRFGSQFDGVFDHVVGHRHLADVLLEGGNFFCRKDRIHRGLGTPCCALDHFQFVGVCGVVDPNVEHKTIKLGFGQGVGSLLFDGVLRGKHEEGVWQFMALASSSHGALLHGLEKGGLRLRGRTVDFIGQNNVGEQWALVELEPTLIVQNLGANDVAGHQVWRELNPVKAQSQCLCDGVHQECFGQARNAHQ